MTSGRVGRTSYAMECSDPWPVSCPHKTCLSGRIPPPPLLLDAGPILGPILWKGEGPMCWENRVILCRLPGIVTRWTFTPASPPMPVETPTKCLAICLSHSLWIPYPWRLLPTTVNPYEKGVARSDDDSSQLDHLGKGTEPLC